MADENQDAGDAKKGGLISKIVVWGLIFVLGAGTGVSVAIFVLPSSSGNASEERDLPNRMDIPEPGEEVDFIEFKEITVNLNDQRFTKYVICKFQLQVAATQKEAIQKLVDEKEAILKNWLIAHLRDKQPEDVRGRLGLNTARREIFDKFNEELFTDGVERIQDVLFQDFKVQ